MRRTLALLWMLALASLVMVMPLTAWFVMIFATFTVGYQASALLQFSSEHLWLVETEPGARRSGELSIGRFCGEAPPAEGVISWIGWVLRMLTFHLLTRLAVLPGSLPSHDARHVNQLLTQLHWRKANFVRSRLIAEGKDFGMANREYWGLGPAIRAVFRSLANTR